MENLKVFKAPFLFNPPFMFQVLTVSFPMSKQKKRWSDPGSFEESNKKQRCASRESKEEKPSSSGIRRQCCSFENTGQMKEEIESYLGFKSVFSFL